MSDTTITAPVEGATDATEPSLAEAISDASRIPDEKGATAFGAILEKFAKRARTAEVSATNAKKALAWARSWGSSYCEGPNGVPDWGSFTAAFGLVVTNPIQKGLGNISPEDAVKINAAVRAHGSRWGTLRAVVLFVALRDESFAEMIGDKLDKVRADWTLGLDSSELDDLVKTPPNDMFVHAVQQQYAKARGEKFLGLPPADSAYAVRTTDGTATGAGAGKQGKGSQQANAAEAMTSAVTGVATVTPLLAVETVRDMLRAFVRHVNADGFKFEGGTRPKIAAVMVETYNNLGLAVKMVSAQTGHEITEAEEKRLAEWASDEKPKTTA